MKDKLQTNKPPKARPARAYALVDQRGEIWLTGIRFSASEVRGFAIAQFKRPGLDGRPAPDAPDIEWWEFIKGRGYSIQRVRIEARG